MAAFFVTMKGNANDFKNKKNNYRNRVLGF